MNVDWQAMKEEWIAEVSRSILPKLASDSRFGRVTDLIDRFHHKIETWRKTNAFRPVIETGNELAAAECLLASLAVGDSLTYEPPMAGTDKRIDFLKISGAGAYEWIEVKTVSPKWADDEAGWLRFSHIAQTFPENAKLAVAKEWGGSAVAGQAIKARWSFIQRAVEAEEQATFIPVNQRGPVWLLFCSTGFEWHQDELEDFADFYRTGNHRADDWLRNAADRYMHDEGIKFSQSLSGFHYLARSHDEVSAHAFSIDVTGPRFGA